MPVLYKIMQQSQWEATQLRGMFVGSEIDLKDGFIHLSASHQVRETAEKHFGGQSGLCLVSVNSEKLGDILKWEVSRGGALFPHVYGQLSFASIDAASPLPLRNGKHIFPESFTS